MANSKDDFSLWLSMVKDIKKLTTKQKATPELKPLPKIDPYKKQQLGATSSISSKNLKDLEVNNKAGIDYSTNKRIERGDYNIDGTLDLHGMIQEQAFNALTRFIAEKFNARKRLLLIIVGKGKQSENKHGLLKELVPEWLNHPSIRPMIINVKIAAPKHGGSGALYILLKRIRNDINYKT